MSGGGGVGARVWGEGQGVGWGWSGGQGVGWGWEPGISPSPKYFEMDKVNIIIKYKYDANYCSSSWT